jgi:hypothetical protein
LQRSACERADEQARRIPWQRIQEVRDQYIDWQEFNLWARSILESEGSVPNWLAEILQKRCPGILEGRKSPILRASKSKPLALSLEDWIDDNIFGFAKREGWYFAITYYAARDSRYQRAEVCWSGCVEKWKKSKPIRYPLFEEWKALAEHCDETAHLVAAERKPRASAKLVDPDRLSEAVVRYMDYEALACWAGHALESVSELPATILCELERRCPGYLDARPKARAKASRDNSQEWDNLMLWIGDHFFQDAKAQGWFEAILVRVRSHPRAIRTTEFADHCDELWGSEMPNPYPAFDDWRRNADSYVELPVN